MKDKMNVSEARELLGTEIESLSDKEVQEMIQRDSALLDAMLDLFDSYQTFENKEFVEWKLCPETVEEYTMLKKLLQHDRISN